MNVASVSRKSGLGLPCEPAPACDAMSETLRLLLLLRSRLRGSKGLRLFSTIALVYSVYDSERQYSRG
jgi:hypothetical protein